MNINFNAVRLFGHNNDANNSARTGYYPNLSPLKQDTVSFGSLKKSGFYDIDLVVVNKFKAPIETFNSNDDFQDWCLEELNSKYMNKDYKGRKEETETKRNEILNEWFNHLNDEDNEYNDSLKLLIIDGITAGLKNDNDLLPPELNKEVLESTICDIKENSIKNKHFQVDFNKLYQNKLQEYYFDLSEYGDDKKTGWIVIPGKNNSPEDFADNVNKLKVLSAHKWCTKSYEAESHLSKGDFHIYLQDGKPAIGICFENNKIQEIQGPNNDKRIPYKFIDEVEKHIRPFRKSDFALSSFLEAKGTKYRVDDFLNKLGKPLSEASSEDLLKAANMLEKRDEDGLLILKSYGMPAPHLTWEDLEINENELLKDVKEIRGYADFFKSKATNIDGIKKIDGDACFYFKGIQPHANMEITGFTQVLVKHN